MTGSTATTLESLDRAVSCPARPPDDHTSLRLLGMQFGCGQQPHVVPYL
jgi:hypothetical protein